MVKLTQNRNKAVQEDQQVQFTAHELNDHVKEVTMGRDSVSNHRGSSSYRKTSIYVPIEFGWIIVIYRWR